MSKNFEKGTLIMDGIRLEINKRFARGVNALIGVRTRAQGQSSRILGDSIRGIDLENEEKRRLASLAK